MAMSTVNNADGVCTKYMIPNYVKELITNDFLKEFRSQLFRIHKCYSLETFAEVGIPSSPSTGGWEAAFFKSCLLTHKESLLNYRRTLHWYEADYFDEELTEMLVERGFILGSLSKIIEEQLEIKEDDLIICNDCKRLYTKDMCVEIRDGDEDEDVMISNYRCLHCQDKKVTLDGSIVTDYYRGILKELNAYEYEHPIVRDGTV